MGWQIPNCTRIADANEQVQQGLAPSGIAFSQCESGDSELPVGGQVSIRVLYFAPTAVVDTGEMEIDIVGLTIPPTTWQVIASMQITPNVVQSAQSSAQLAVGTVTAMATSDILVTPRDMYQNVISAFGLQFSAQAAHAELQDDLTYLSVYDFDAQSYTIPIQLPRMGFFTITVVLVDEPIEVIRTTADAVSCDEVSSPNADGSGCICNDGYARQDSGECGRCSPGTQPQTDAEQGCESCALFNFVSGTGLECVPCISGRPNADNSDCEPCPENEYYDVQLNACVACGPGQRLNPEAGASLGVPCASCGPGTFGLNGVCEHCESGKQPNDPLMTACQPCPVGYAGTGGFCELCPPGKSQSSDQDGCEICAPGSFRDAEIIDHCSDCPQRREGTHGMISDAGSTNVRDCYCPRAYYDRLDHNGVDAPVTCYDEGRTRRAVLGSPANELSARDFSTDKRCLKCPDCLVCDFDAYRGRPYVAEGFTVVGAAEKETGSRPALSMHDGVPAPDMHAGRPWFIDNQRDVFACPTGSACRAEREYRNGTSAQTDMQLCVTGYSGELCAYCSDNFSAGKTGCELCGTVGEAVVPMVSIAALIVAGWFAKRKYAMSHAGKKYAKPANIVASAKVLLRVIPSIVADIKVFIGVYQTLSNMGGTLSLRFPASVERWLDIVRGFVNVDIFSLPAFSCLVSGSFYSRLWASLLVPTMLLCALYVVYSSKLSKMHADHIPDLEQDEEAQAYLQNKRAKEAKAKEANTKDWHREDLSRHRRHEAAEDESKSHESAFARHEHAAQLKKRVHRLERKQALQNETISWAFFVVFLAYPPAVRTIFSLFYCLEMDEEHSFLAADLSISCTDAVYSAHYFFCVFLVFIIPLGIPFGFGYHIYLTRDAILDHRGPIHLTKLYEDYKPEHPLWEIYQMVQKVVLIGLLAFIDRGSILQCLIGLIISNLVLMAMVRCQPYAKLQTNVLCITGQSIVVLSYLSAMLLRMDLGNERLTVDAIGTVIIIANVPMAVILVWDTYHTMKNELQTAQTNLLSSELGGRGERYLCKKEVEITKRLNFTRRTKTVLGKIQPGEEVVALGQGFNKKADARLKIDRGWVSFSSDGLLGDRYFTLMHSDKPERTGKLNFKIVRDGAQVVVTVLSAKGLKDMDRLLGKNDVYVAVEVGGERKQTQTMKDAGAAAKWGKHGEALVFEDTTAWGPTLDDVVLECFDENFDEGEDDDFIGSCVFPAHLFGDAGDQWDWEGSRVIRDRPRGARREEVEAEEEVNSLTFDVETPTERKEGGKGGGGGKTHRKGWRGGKAKAGREKHESSIVDETFNPLADTGSPPRSPRAAAGGEGDVDGQEPLAAEAATAAGADERAGAKAGDA